VRVELNHGTKRALQVPTNDRARAGRTGADGDRCGNISATRYQEGLQQAAVRHALADERGASMSLPNEGRQPYEKPVLWKRVNDQWVIVTEEKNG